VVRAAAQAAVVLTRDERLRLLAGSALGGRTDQSQQSAELRIKMTVVLAGAEQLLSRGWHP